MVPMCPLFRGHIVPPTVKCQLLGHMSVFALLQLVGILALVFFVLFVRSQYLRVEQVSQDYILR